jgi:hypothetical protein
MITPQAELVELFALKELIVANHGLEGYVNDMMLHQLSPPTKADKVPAGSDRGRPIQHQHKQRSKFSVLPGQP